MSAELIGFLVFAGFVAGFISAIAGSGGMIVLPILLWAGLPPVNALATNKFQSVFGTLSSSWNFFSKGHIDLRELGSALVFALIGACIGTWLVQQLDTAVLETIMPVMLLFMAFYLAFSPKLSDKDHPPRMARRPFNAIVGGGVGLYGGFFGPGMGSIYAIAFASLRGNNLRKATAHTKPLVLVTNVTSMTVFTLAGHVFWQVAIFMALAQILGARIGSGLVISRGSALVKPLVILVTVAAAVKLMVD